MILGSNIILMIDIKISSTVNLICKVSLANLMIPNQDGIISLYLIYVSDFFIAILLISGLQDSRVFRRRMG
jgi:hypothetical protein